MSMETLTIFQLAGIFCAYLLVTVGLPAFVFGGKMRGHRAPERLIFYFMTGNFYIMNLVFVLQLLKISYPLTLILGTVAPAAVARIAIYRVPVLKIAMESIHYVHKLAEGRVGAKTTVYKIGAGIRRQLIRFFKWIGYFVFRRFFDCVLTAALLAALWWIYGNNLLEQFGYKASDILVHNYWINALSRNHIFVAGVYPHGFHNIIYYLHAVFGIETFVLLRVFAFVQNVMLHLMILCCLRMCCKSKYAAYIGTFIFAAGSFFKPNTFSRYYATLPQEFGIIFILPAIYFLFAYFEVRRAEFTAVPATVEGRGGDGLKEDGKKEKRKKGGSKKEAESKKEAKREEKKQKKKSRTEAVQAGKEQKEKDRREAGQTKEIDLIDDFPIDDIGNADFLIDDFPLDEEGKPREREPEREMPDDRKALTEETDLLEIDLEEIDLDETDFGSAGDGSSKKWKRFPFGKRKSREKELPRGRRVQKHYPKSWLYLAVFAMSFSMTLAVHFYGTMVAGIYCMGIAVGYASMLFKKPYFRNVMAAGLISVGVAVLPMLLAFLGGTPLQGSLGWGMNIIKGTGKESSTPVNDKTENENEDEEKEEGVNDTPKESEGNVVSDGEGITVNQGVDMNEEEVPEEPRVSLSERLKRLPGAIIGFGPKAWHDIYRSLKNAVFNLENENDIHWIMLSFFVLIGMGLLYLAFRQPCYGGMLVSTGVYMIFMCMLMASATFHIPPLMDNNRGSIYFSYSMPVVISFLVDGVLYLPIFPLKKLPARVGRVLMNVVSLACVVGAVYYMVEMDRVKTPRNPHGQVPNEAVICLTNIIHSEEDFTWTIVSANDELRMGEEYGYHYETITFLREMEGASPNAFIRIPTKVVYFFIEKVPVDYYVAYENSGQPISREGAARPLSYSASISVYQGEQRWVTMSRMYYWAQNFISLYPDEMKVYMETDDFVCYRIEQNPYRLYNFAINYGFNAYDYYSSNEEQTD